MLPAVLFLCLFAVLWAAYELVLPATWRIARWAWAAITRALLRRQRLAVWYERGTARLLPLHPYRPLILIVAVGFVAAGLTGAAFFQLAERVHAHSATLQAVDYRVWQSARQIRNPAATTFFLAWTLLGTPVGISVVLLPVVVALFMKGRRMLPLFLVVSTLGGWALNHALKVFFARARPDLSLALRSSSGYSFPSGHAMMSVIAFGALAYVVIRLRQGRRLHSAVLAFTSCMVAAISLSRVYLGVHWLSDIVAGVAAGIVWLAATVAAYEVFRRLRMLRAAPRPAA